MGRPLNAITIKGYKSIRELVGFPLNSLNVLIGANGSGKTNFISAFKLLNQIVNQNLQGYVGLCGGADALLYFGRKTTDQITLDLTFGANGYSCTLMPAAGDVLVLGNEQAIGYPGQSDSPITRNFRDGHKETQLYDFSGAPPTLTMTDNVSDALRSWRVYHFHDTSPGARVKQTADLQDNQTLHSDAANLAAFLYQLQKTHPDYYQQIIATVRLVAPFFDDFALGPNLLNPNTILLRWREKGAEGSRGADLLSDGTLRFICLATLLLQPRLPATLLIDEPELGLHPYAIHLLASLLRSAAAQTQVIVSTQSVTLVNQFQPEEVVVVDRQDNQSVFRRHTQVDIENWLDEYGMGDLWEKNVLGGRPR